MNESDDFERGEFRGKVLGELNSLKDGMEKMSVLFHDFKVGIGMRVEKHGNEITEIKTHQGVMAKIMWVIGTATLTALVAAMFRLILK